MERDALDLPFVEKYVDVYPKYYQGANLIECWDAWEAMGILEPACIALIMKYLWRREGKGSKMEDLLKARAYLDKLINHLGDKENVLPDTHRESAYNPD